MIGKATRSLGNAWDDGRGLPYRFVGDDWFGGWTTVAGGFTIQAQGTEGDDVVTGTDADERYRGLGGNDTISGGGGRDHLFGDEGDDTIDGGSGNDVLFPGLGNNVIYGGDGNDQITPDLSGVEGNVFYGGDGSDLLGSDFSSLFGGRGDDTLQGEGCFMRGGGGNDRLDIGDPFRIDGYSHEVWGGPGFDRFVFDSETGAPLGGGVQVIHDLSSEDHIDLSPLDARRGRPGDQAFELVPEFTGKQGEMTIRYDAEHDRTLIELYNDGDNVVDGTIVIPGDFTTFDNFTF